MELVNLPAIGEVIREYRLKAGWSQQRLGEEIGLNASCQQRVMQWESGNRKPAAEYLLKIIRVLNIPVDAFDEYNEVGEK